MIGDLYLFITLFWKQTFCIHDYKHARFMQYHTKTCKKCGRIK